MNIPGINRFTVSAAFIATASRFVGASFRVGEAYDPRVRASGATLDPKLVLKRESITLGLSWFASLFTAMGVAHVVKRFPLSRVTRRLLIAVIGTGVAEAVGRLVAYRSLGKTPPQKPKAPASNMESQVPQPASAPKVTTAGEPLPNQAVPGATGQTQSPFAVPSANAGMPSVPVAPVRYLQPNLQRVMNPGGAQTMGRLPVPMAHVSPPIKPGLT